MNAEPWRDLFIQLAGQNWEQEAAARGVAKQTILDHPYAP